MIFLLEGVSKISPMLRLSFLEGVMVVEGGEVEEVNVVGMLLFSVRLLFNVVKITVVCVVFGLGVVVVVVIID